VAESYQVFGRPLLRVDAPDKLTGKAIYAGDISLPGMLYLKVLRSDRPHAKILGIHTARAKTYPGVIRVFTHQDIPGMNRVGPRNKDQPVLCDDRVRYVGDPVALVAAETSEAAEEAVPLMRVDYEDLPGIFSPEEALAPEAPKIHEAGNVLLERVLLRGNPDQALKEADVVITNTYRTQMVEHGYLEPEAGVAKYENGKITVWMPSKHAHFDHKEIAGVLGLPLENVRVILTTIGGSFGDKQGLSPGYYVAFASLKTGRPCMMVYDRKESFVASTKRHPFVIHYTTGAKKDGTIIAAKVEIVADTGAYTSYGPSILVRALTHAAGPYEIPNVYVRARAIFTNNPVAGAMRGFGVPQVVVAYESQVDILAETLRMDPFEIRLKNGMKPGSLTATGQSLNASVGYAETIEKVREEITRRGVPISFGSKRYGWGVASMFYGIGLTGLPNPGFCRIEAHDSGDFTLYLGCGDMGQGSATTMTQIASEVLRSTPEKIHLMIGDTDLCPDSGTSTASRVTYIVGRSVQLASENLRELLRESTAPILGIAKEEVVLDKGFLYPSEASHQKISISEVVKKLKNDGISPAGEGTFNPETTPLDIKTGQGSPYGTYSFAAQGALVSADMDTGEVEVLDVVASHDVGRAVNPINVVAQIEGGVSMGLGYGLMEEVVVEEGTIRNPRFSEYFIPTALDVPEVTSLLVECEEPTGPFGAKGVGEPALLPTAPAILNAIAVATGIRIKEIPVTPEKLWRLLKEH
jgi:nicotinate dehydrogenase large molybdopterin subunit